MNVNLTLTDILLEFTRETYHALNLMILLIKQYIFYKSRKKPICCRLMKLRNVY